jgi:PAS domain-containing protein
MVAPALPPHEDEHRRARLRALGLPEQAAQGALTDQLLDRVAQLQINDARLTDFARASGDWLWETDAALKFIWLSDTFTRTTGESTATTIGTSLVESRLFDEGGRGRAATALAGLLQRRAAFTRVLTLLPTSRGELKVSHSAVPTFDAEGRFAGYRGTARDVTAQINAEIQVSAQAELLRRSEERWEMAARATGIGVAELDVPTNTLQLDGRARINHGLDGPVRALDLNEWLDAIHPDDRPEVRAALQTTIAECSRLEVRYRNRGAHGVERVLEIVAHGVRGLGAVSYTHLRAHETM